jgi:hypothetical protein
MPGPDAPRDWAPRTDLAAAAAVAAVLAQVTLAQLTLVLAACFVLIGRVTRWRPSWLGIPAVAGLAWMLAVGVRPALAGYLDCAGRVVADLTGAGPVPVRLEHVRAVFAAWRHWLPGQPPVALLGAAAEAAVLSTLAHARRGRTYRAGAVTAARRTYLSLELRRGEVATGDGGSVGIAQSTGRRVAVSWQEARTGVLCTGQDPAAVAATGMELAAAAIQHRKAVLIIDLAAALRDGTDGRPGRPGPVSSVSSTCADAGAPLRCFGLLAGQYDPLGAASPARAASLVLAMIDWAGVGHSEQLFCANYVSAVLMAIAASARAAASPPAPLLADLVSLTAPGQLAATVRRPPWQLALPAALAARITDLAGRLDAEPAVVAPLASQLARLNSAALAGRLGPGPEAPVSFARALAERQVVLFELDRRIHGRAADMVARLAVADLLEVLAERSDREAPADCLVWINGCEVIDPTQLAVLVAIGGRTGTAVMLGTASDRAAARLVGEVNVVAVRGPAPGLAGQPGEPAGVSLSTYGSNGLPEHQLRSQGPDTLVVRVAGPQPRLVTGCRAVR